MLKKPWFLADFTLVGGRSSLDKQHRIFNNYVAFVFSDAPLSHLLTWEQFIFFFQIALQLSIPMLPFS